MKKYLMISLLSAVLSAGTLCMPFAALAEEADTPAEATTAEGTADGADGTDPAEPDADEEADSASGKEETDDTDTQRPALIRPADCVHYDENGKAYYSDGEERITGRFTAVPNFQMGNVNDDTSVDALDASAILIASAAAGAGGVPAQEGIINGTSIANAEEAVMYGDVNEDGVINALDAADILIYSAKIGSGASVPAIGSKTFYADANGILQTGWIHDGDDVYYGTENCELASGWLQLEGSRYYLNEDGILQTGWITLSSGRYYLDELAAGAAATGWKETGEGFRWFDDSGMMATGWKTLDDKDYYFDQDGLMVTGTVKLAGGTYYFELDGTLALGWKVLNGSQYYFTRESGMVTGWLEENGSFCYFASDGRMKKGWLALDGKKYYLGDDGFRVTGWQTIDSSRYFFDTDGVMAVNQKIDGYVIGEDGIAVSELYAANKTRADEAFAKYGTSVRGIFDFVRATTRYKKTESTKTLAEIEELGWMYFVDYSMTHYYGVCYYLAAKTDFMLQEAGYTCRIVHATHESGDHYWNQVYENGVWVNYDLTNNWYAKTWDQMVALGNYKLIGYVTPKYK